MRSPIRCSLWAQVSNPRLFLRAVERSRSRSSVWAQIRALFSLPRGLFADVIWLFLLSRSFILLPKPFTLSPIYRNLCVDELHTIGQ